MYRIFVGSFAHETNTFWPSKTGVDAFRSRYYLTGQDVVDYFGNTLTPMGGFIDVLHKYGAEGVFSVAASAEPSGYVTKEAFEEVKGILLKDLTAAGQIDGVLLALHGAMVAEHEEDGEGNILEAVREIVGPDMPVIATLDLHANITKRMVDCATAMIPHHEYPHVDGYDRSLEAAEMMMGTIRGELHPVMTFRHPPLLASLTETETASYQPVAEACRKARECPGVLEATIAHGFFAADIPDAGVTSLVITDGDEKLADCIAKQLADVAWEYRDRLAIIPTYTPEEAIAEAGKTDGLVVFADICDNSGAGSSGDGTKLLRAMLDAKVTKAAYAAITDPQVVEICCRAGVGSYVDIELGGKTAPEMMGAPIPCRAYVKGIFDGRYVNKGPMQAGVEFNMKKTAVIEVDGISIIVASVARQPFDIEVFRSHGLTPSDFHILVVKSSVHYRASFGPYAKKMLSVECPGILKIDPRQLPYVNVRRPIYPLDEVIELQ